MQGKKRWHASGASLMKEWHIDRPWQGAAGWSILMGKRSLLGDSPRSPGSLRQRGNGREMNSSSKKDTRADGWMWGWLNGRLFRRLGGLVVNACTLDLFKAGVSKATVMQMIQGAKNLSSICVRLTATCLTLASWQKDKIKINYSETGDSFNRGSAK